MNAKTILIIEDEVGIREVIRMALEVAGYECLEAGDIVEGHSLIIDQHPALVLLDWMLPGGSGIDLLRRLRSDELTAELPVIMLTAKGEEDNKVQGFDVGADDYITKPFAPREMVSRVKALMRRAGHDDNEKLIEVGGIKMDPAGHRVYVDGGEVKMGPTEYRLLKFFLTHQERAYSRAQLLDRVWGGNVYVEERTVDVHIRRLRKGLSGSSYDYGSYIQTVRGAGYRFSINV
jgi:two-component system phosphate regulon response regulator PhoB